jgi:hypothetical protein
MAAPSLLSIKQFAARHSAFTEGSLRWLRFEAATNGFASAFVTIGRRVLIDEDLFFQCVQRNQRNCAVDHVTADGGAL